MRPTTAFAAGMAFGGAIAAGLCLRPAAAAAPSGATPPATVVLHRFDVVPGRAGKLAEWMAFLHVHHREAVATLDRERTYLEAMFTAPDEPYRLYWLTVQGPGGAMVESSDLAVDRAHRAYMAAVLVPGSHRRLATRNVLAPDFLLEAIRRDRGSPAR